MHANLYAFYDPHHKEFCGGRLLLPPSVCRLVSRTRNVVGGRVFGVLKYDSYRIWTVNFGQLRLPRPSE